MELRYKKTSRLWSWSVTELKIQVLLGKEKIPLAEDTTWSKEAIPWALFSPQPTCCHPWFATSVLYTYYYQCVTLVV
jgi:hypothetical protein